MRTLALVVAAVTVALFAAAIPATAAAPGDVPSALPTLSVTVLGDSVSGKPFFQTVGLTQQNLILIPQVPIRINLTFVNNETASGLGTHTFTIDNTASAHKVDIVLAPQTNGSVEFTLNSMTNVTYNGTSFTPVAGATGGIQFYCIPHKALGMIGEIVLATAAQQPVPVEKGINIRAYWIGMIGIISMIVWIGISYYVIKTSSPRFRDHREHVRKGLP